MDGPPLFRSATAACLQPRPNLIELQYEYASSMGPDDQFSVSGVDLQVMDGSGGEGRRQGVPASPPSPDTYTPSSVPT